MKHTVFALFHRLPAADHAVRRLVELDASLPEHLSLVVHRQVANEGALEELVQHVGTADETDARHGRAIGAVVGGALGAALGTLIAGPPGILAGGPLTGLLFGAGTGTLHGLLAAGLVGTGLADHTLKKLATRIEAGDVLLAVQTPDAKTEARVESLLREHGAVVAEKHAL